ncbi:MAG: metalloregulator ArsR/SmtB family transcription factor [Planctomycetota bacterium]
MQGTGTLESPPASADPLEPVFKALADPTRREILDLLRSARRTTGELSRAFPELTRFAVMKHLRVLESAGLVTTAKDGRQKWNTINAVPLRRLYERWVSRYADLWATGLTRLQDLVEHATEEGTEMTTAQTTPTRIAHIHQEIRVTASVDRVFNTFTERVGEWFQSCGRPGENVMRLQPRVGGLLFEDYGHGSGVTLATITHFEPNKRIGMTGGFSCIEACVSNVFFDFSEESGATTIKMRHHMAGEINDQYVAEFDAGWTDLFEAFKKLVEG